MQFSHFYNAKVIQPSFEKRRDEDNISKAFGLIWLSMLDMGGSTHHISNPWRDTPGISRTPHETRTSLRDSISTSLCRMCLH